jgi:hypothetical protein
MYMYLRPLVVDCDLIVAVGIFAGKERFQSLLDVYLEATWLHGDLICGVLAGVQWHMLRQVRTVTDAPPSTDAFADWGIAAAGAICVLCRRQYHHANGRRAGRSTHSRVGAGSDVLLRVALPVVDVRCSVRVEHSRGSARLQRLRAHAMGMRSEHTSQVSLW